MSLSINGKTIKSLMKDGKEIVKVERVEDGKILYEKENNNNYVVATVTGNDITLSNNWSSRWLTTTGDVIIDWGDGTQSTVNNPSGSLTHSYTDEKQNHDIVFIGEVTSFIHTFDRCTGLTSIMIPDSIVSLGDSCLSRTGLTSIVIPDSVESLGNYCFYRCTGLTSIVIPDSVVRLGSSCFYYCTSLIDYQLYWTGNNIITYDSGNMPNNTNSTFTIPVGETANYVAKGYPSDKLVERSTS